MKIFYTSVFILLMLNCTAQWSNTTNQFYDSLQMQVCTATGDQTKAMSITSNPDGGTIIFWEDKRSGFYGNIQIFAQKFDKAGNRLWAVNGVPISAGTNNQHFYTSSNQDYRNRSFAATDGAGGFYITYTDDSISNYAWYRMCVQHIKSDGSAVFSGAGFITAATPSGQSYNFTSPQLIADDNSGFYIAYVKKGFPDYLYVYCYKDEAGTMTYKGGGIVNENGLQKTDPQPCVGANKWFIVYPNTDVIDYNIWPDLQGGCSVVMSMNGNDAGQYKMLCYNRVWKTKNASTVTIATQFPTGNPDQQIINYKQGDIAILYQLKHKLLNGQCSSNAATYLWVDDILTSNGYQLLDQGGYDYNFPKGVTIATPGNINVELLASIKRTYVNNTVSNFVGEAIAIPVEKYDSVPYQRASNTNPNFGYNTTAPTQMDKLIPFRDTILSEGRYYYDFSLAGGGGQFYASALVWENDGSGSNDRKIRLQHLAVEIQSANTFAIAYKTTTKTGELIGKEISNGFGGSNISYEFPQVTVNNTGNALFYINETDRYTRVSPIENGAQLSWGAMGRPLGTPLFNGSYYYPQAPFASLDPLNGTGVICWQDNKNVPASSGTNISMRHLDNLNVANYISPNKKVELLSAFTSSSFPVNLLGSSKKYSIIEGYNNITKITSPVVEILDNYNLGAMSVQIYQHPGPIRTFSGKPYLNRNYTIKPENNPAGGANINVRLYFTTTEFDALKAADVSISNPGSLVVIKQPNNGVAVPAAYTPLAGEQFIVPTAWQAVDGGYYLEIAVTGFSNFFIQNTSSPLPVKWLGVQAQWQNTTQAKVTWQVAEQLNVKNYTVQQSLDGTVFKDVCTIAASPAVNYNCLVPANSNAKNYYRIAAQDIDGKLNYSKVVLLQASVNAAVSLYPNPAKDKLVLDGLPSGYRTMQIMDAGGKIIYRQNVLPGLQNINIKPLAAGIYTLIVIGDKQMQTLSFIKN